MGRLVRLTVACQKRRHGSVATVEMADWLVWEAWGGAYGVDIEHHHIDHPSLTVSIPARPVRRIKKGRPPGNSGWPPLLI